MLYTYHFLIYFTLIGCILLAVLSFAFLSSGSEYLCLGKKNSILDFLVALLFEDSLEIIVF